MKSVWFVFALLLLGQMSYAQKHNDPKGHVINDKGQVYFEGMKFGVITKDSILKNNQGKKIAFVRPGGILEDANGKVLGQMGKDGQTYYNANGQLVFSVKEDTNTGTCDVVDANGNVIGNVHSNYKALVCVLHCSMNKMEMKSHKKTK